MSRKNFEIFSVICFYTVTAISSVVVNKHFLKSVTVPLTLLELQLIVTSVALIAGYQIFKLFKRTQGNGQQSDKVESKTKFETIKLLWPMVICNVFGLAFNIICLSKIDAIMHQVTRGITLPLTALFGPILGYDSSSWRVFVICFSIFMGFSIAVSGEVKSTQISLFGISAGLLSSAINAYNALFIKSRFQGGNKFSALDLVYFNNIFSAILLAPICLLYEGRQLPSINNWGHVVYVSLITGILGLLINYAGFLQIKVTSPVTHCVSSVARGIIQIMACNLFLKEKLTITRMIGISLSLISSSLYPMVKSYDNSLKKKYQELQTSNESIKISAITVDSNSENK